METKIPASEVSTNQSVPWQRFSPFLSRKPALDDHHDDADCHDNNEAVAFAATASVSL